MTTNHLEMVAKINKEEVKRFLDEDTDSNHYIILLPKCNKEFFVSATKEVNLSDSKAIYAILEKYPSLLLPTDEFIKIPKNFNTLKIVLAKNQEIIIGLDEGIFISSYLEDLELICNFFPNLQVEPEDITSIIATMATS